MSNDLPNIQGTQSVNDLPTVKVNPVSTDYTDIPTVVPGIKPIIKNTADFQAPLKNNASGVNDSPGFPNNTPTPTVIPTPGGFVGGGKEGERIDRGLAEQKVELEELGKEMEISKELEKMGVEKAPTEFPVPKEIKDFVEPLAGPSTPIKEEPKVVNIPLQDDQISMGVKQKISSSIRWLAEFCLKQIKKTHIKIKFVKGKIVRITTG